MNEVRKGSVIVWSHKIERKENDINKRNRIKEKFPTKNPGFSPDGS